MARFNISGSGGIDRRAQAQAADLQQQQLDQSQNDHLLNQALQFYGIGQSHNMDAERLHAMQLENTGREIANRSAGTSADWGPYAHDLASRQSEQQLAQQGQMFPEQLKGAQIGNQRAQTASDWDPYNLDLASRHGELAQRQGQQTLDQSAQLFPAQQSHLELENTGQRQQNDWTPWLNQARYDATNAMADKNQGLNTHDAIVLRQMGYLNDEDLNKLMPPDIQHAHAAAAQAAEIQRQAAIVADQSQQNGPHAPSRSMYDSASTLGDNAANMLYDIPSSVYNTVHGLGDVVSGLLGGPQFNRLRPVSQIKAANRKGSDFSSVFYDPRDPNANTPLPVARSSKP